MQTTVIALAAVTAASVCNTAFRRATLPQQIEFYASSIHALEENRAVVPYLFQKMPKSQTIAKLAEFDIQIAEEQDMLLRMQQWLDKPLWSQLISFRI